MFMDDTVPGIVRRKVRGHWAYFDPKGARITDREEIDRLNAIALPPAYTGAWFAPRANAHLQAIGYDAKGRKQYRYHPDWSAEREMRKFELCAPFGRKLKALRKRVKKDLRRRKLTRDRAIASVVALLDTGQIRIGNECYAKSNKSFGATTLRRRHAMLSGRSLTLRFRGKSGRKREIACDDPALLRYVRRVQDLPGQHLFQYLEEDGTASAVTSDDVNAYLRETMGEDFSARNFRTWSASALAFGLLHAKPEITVGAMMEEVADRLGNTPAVARKAYVHPAVVAAAKGEAARKDMPKRLPRRTRTMTREERGLLAFLEKRTKR